MDLSIPRPRLAVLIDAENVSPNRVRALFERIAGLGDARLRRAYGDFSGTALSAWKAPAHAYALTLQHCVGQAAGKNGADIALAIDAMDLLHERLFDAFCLVSSDSDFTRLALRLRERGVRVHGFGEAKTLESFRAACDRFHLLGTAEPATARAASPPAPATPARTATCALTASRAASSAMPSLELALAACQPDRDGWVYLAELGSRLGRDFKLQDYGFNHLGRLMAELNVFETRRIGQGADQVRRRPPG